MNITLKLYATLSDYLPDEARTTNALHLDVDARMTIDALMRDFHLPQKLCHLVLVDGLFVAPAQRASRVLKEGETLAIWPPIAGG